MVQVVDSQKLQSVADIYNQYKNCKVLIRDFVREDGSVTKGYVYAVSTSSDSFVTLFDYKDELKDKNIDCMLIGSYNNGGGIGIQYIVQKTNG